MSVWFFASAALLLVYLLVQAVEDARTATVYTVLNNFVVAFVAAMYLGKCLVLGAFPSLVVPAVVSIALLTHKFVLRHIMGIGDAKAYAAVFLQGGLFFKESTAFFLPFPVAVVFFSNLAFSLWVVANGIARRKNAKDIFFSHERRAFFPSLFVGYAASLALMILLQVRY